MQISNILTSLVLIASVSSAFTPTTDDCRPLLGDLSDCGLPSDLLHITEVSVNPSKPVRGEKITISLTGDLSDDIPDGTTAHLTAKREGVTVIDKTYNFCTVIGNGENKCPVKKGHVTTTKEIQIPANIPDGSYVLDGTINTPSNQQVAHVQLKITFSS